MMKPLWLVAIPALVWGQTEAGSAFNPISSAQGWLHLQGVSAYSGYFSSGAPHGFEVPTGSPFLPGPSAVGGITATVGGSKQAEKSTFTWNYSPSYFNLFYSNNEISSQGSLNHRAGVTWSRKLGSRNKWTLSSAVHGMVANLEQLYFSPGTLSNIASAPTSFDALAAGMLTGKFTDPQLASILTGSALQASPEQGYLYGNRVLDVAANVVLGWAPSERTSISATLGGTRAQPLNQGGADANSSSTLVQKTTIATGQISWSYTLSSRTQLGIGASSNRTFSRLLQGYGSNAHFTVGRTMSRRWFVHGSGGVGKLTYMSQTYAAPKSVQYLYGGGLGFKTYTHTFLVSYNRSLGDVYGLGSSATISGTAAWNWNRPGTSWSLFAHSTYQELKNQTFENTRSWGAGAGVAKTLSSHVFMSAQYIYLQLPLDLRTGGADRAQNGVFVSMTFSPSGYQ